MRRRTRLFIFAAGVLGALALLGASLGAQSGDADAELITAPTIVVSVGTQLPTETASPTPTPTERLSASTPPTVQTPTIDISQTGVPSTPTASPTGTATTEPAETVTATATMEIIVASATLRIEWPKRLERSVSGTIRVTVKLRPSDDEPATTTGDRATAEQTLPSVAQPDVPAALGIDPSIGSEVVASLVAAGFAVDPAGEQVRPLVGDGFSLVWSIRNENAGNHDVFLTLRTRPLGSGNGPDLSSDWVDRQFSIRVESSVLSFAGVPAGILGGALALIVTSFVGPLLVEVIKPRLLKPKPGPAPTPTPPPAKQGKGPRRRRK